MISVVIGTHDDERTLGQCLAALVPAAIDGLVRDVVLADAGSTDDTLEIADDAGARVVQGDVDAAIAASRADWLLIIDADHLVPEGWDAAVVRHVKRGWDKPACWGRKGLLPFGPAPALLVSRRLYQQVGGYGPALGKAARLRI